MKMPPLLLLSAFYCNACLATVCSMPENLQAELSEKYKGEVTIQLDESDSILSIAVTLPTHVEGTPFVSVSIWNDSNYFYWFELATITENDKILTRFEISADLARNANLTVNYSHYKDKCGPTLGYRLY